MRERTFTLLNNYGLDSREAGLLIQKANRFKSALEITRYDDPSVVANGKDVMGLMLLAAGRGSSITVKAIGPDEAAVLEALGGLIEEWGQRDADQLERSKEPESWRSPSQPPDFSRDTSRSASLEPTGTYLLDPSPWPAPPIKSRAALSVQLAALQGVNISMKDLELLIDKFVKRPLQKVKHPDERTLLIGACAAATDFQKPIDEWIAALESSEVLRKSKRARQKRLKALLEADLEIRLGLPAPAPKSRAKRTTKKTTPQRPRRGARFAMHSDKSSQRTILLDTKTGDTWILEGSKWVKISRD